MSDYFEEESPWSRPLSGEFGSVLNGTEDAGAPWAGASDRDDSDGDADMAGAGTSYDPFGDPYGDDGMPVATASTEEQEAAAEVESEQAPVLKQASQRARTGKKRRAGAIKVESVNSDPLASQSADLDDVALSVKAANPSNDGESELGHAQGSRSGSIDAGGNDDAALSGSVADLHLSSSHSRLKTSPLPSEPPSSEFEITVSDAATAGDLTNPYTVYTVQMKTTSESYEEKEAVVQRRYRDFRWLYRTLEHSHPGVIVPPPPEKQLVGRFNDDFIQQRRAALETMLVKITTHPLLAGDSDLRAFLTNPDFGEYLKTRLMTDKELEAVTGSIVNQGDSPRQSVYPDSTGSSSTGGFIGTLSGALSLSRGNEADPWTVDKRAELDELESQLRAATRSLYAVSTHRQQLSDTIADFANVTRTLGDVEPTPRLGKVLRAFAKVHDRLAEIYARQRQQDLLTLEATLDEHLRVVNSARDAISARQRVFSAAEAAGAEVERHQASLDRVHRQARTQEDRMRSLEEEVEQYTQRASNLHQQAADIARLVDAELARVSQEKTRELRNSVELYLENMVEAQKEAIEIWETFYTRYFTKSQG